MPGAVEAYDKLNEYFNVYILSTGPWGNSHSLCEKVEWIKEHLPSAHKTIIFSHHKDLCRGDYLIDDSEKNVDVIKDNSQEVVVSKNLVVIC